MARLGKRPREAAQVRSEPRLRIQARYSCNVHQWCRHRLDVLGTDSDARQVRALKSRTSSLVHFARGDEVDASISHQSAESHCLARLRISPLTRYVGAAESGRAGVATMKRSGRISMLLVCGSLALGCLQGGCASELSRAETQPPA